METVTLHRLINGDARDLSFRGDASVHLIVTSPPYWNLKRYNENPDQLGHIQDYEAFLFELEKVWRHSYRVLVPGGRLVGVVGDVCVARRDFGRHLVFPLHADIGVLCRRLGFDNLNPIIWHKIANASYEVENGSKFLGKPYEPNAIIKNDMEFILMQRKPGGYRKPTEAQREASRIGKDDFDRWFQQIWPIPGASTKPHPAPFPLELATRLVRMFSFTGDTVLDPFCGSGTTMIAALRNGGHSIEVEIEPEYCRLAARYLKAETRDLFATAKLVFEKRLSERRVGSRRIKPCMKFGPPGRNSNRPTMACLLVRGILVSLRSHQNWAPRRSLDTRDRSEGAAPAVKRPLRKPYPHFSGVWPGVIP